MPVIRLLTAQKEPTLQIKNKVRRRTDEPPDLRLAGESRLTRPEVKKVPQVAPFFLSHNGTREEPDRQCLLN
jgi:hypothetical protein